jgi:hypothetical protein
MYDDKNSRASLAQSIDSKITEGLARNQQAVTKVITEKSNLTRRPYKDIEGEMEDYEQVDEDEFEEDSDGGVEETAAMPRPAYGQM